MRWGTEAGIAELLGNGAEIKTAVKRTFDFCYRSPGHFAQWFQLYYGPINRLAASLDDAARAQFGAELAEVATSFNRAEDQTVLAASEYLEVVAVRR